METIKHNGKDIPVKHADVKVTIKHKETGVSYKDEAEWKGLGLAPSHIKRDVLVT